ncbi:lipopolysaccharide biosynthesis protein [Cellulosimicrobium cellulans]|uniref:lipopolysaccharide biosynthesis protein n=1 Tax=Cellulosimicrobium cellulans TaxID=1710 RepID=UPI0036EBDE4C
MTRNGLLYLIGAAIQGLAVLAVTPFATRLLGETEYGKVALAIVLTQTVATVLAAGFPQLILRDHQRGEDGVRDARVFVGIMIVGAMGAAALGAVAALLLLLAGSSATALTVLVVTVGSAGLTCVIACQSVFRATERPLAFATMAIASTLGAQLVGIGLSWFSRTAEAYLLGFMATLLGLAVVAVVVTRPVWPWHDLPRTRVATRTALTMLPHGVAMLVLLSGDTIIAGVFRGPTAVATYQPALLLGNVAFVAATAIYNAWGPAVYRRDPRTRWQWTGRSAVLFGLLLAGVGAVVTVVAPWAVAILTGPEFDRTTIVTLVSVLAWTAVPYILYLACSLALIEHGRTGRLAGVASVIAAVFVLGGGLAVAGSGLEALAVAKLVAYSLLFVATWRAASSDVPLRFVGWPAWVAGGVPILVVSAALVAPGTVVIVVALISLPLLAVTAWVQRARSSASAASNE